MNDQPQTNVNPYGVTADQPVANPNPLYTQTTEPTVNPVQTQPTVDTVQLSDLNNDSLLDIKQKALTALTPMINNIDQSPEEKFKTILMLIQASDNQELIKDAYVAAEKITDVKARTQALLDIINEINYFTQQKA